MRLEPITHNEDLVPVEQETECLQQPAEDGSEDRADHVEDAGYQIVNLVGRIEQRRCDVVRAVDEERHRRPARIHDDIDHLRESAGHGVPGARPVDAQERALSLGREERTLVAAMLREVE